LRFVLSDAETVVARPPVLSVRRVSAETLGDPYWEPVSSGSSGRGTFDLHRLVTDYIDHYNCHRPHRALQQQPPSFAEAATDANGSPTDNVIRFPCCDGLIDEYENAA